MSSVIKRLLRDERAATTVDWVALTGGVILFGIAVIYAIFNSGVAPVVKSVGTMGETGAESLENAAKYTQVDFD